MSLVRVVLIFCAALLDGRDATIYTDFSLFSLALNSLQCSNKSSEPDVSEIKMYKCGSDLNSSVYLNESVAAIINCTNGNLNHTKFNMWMGGFNSTYENQQYPFCTDFEGIINSLALIYDAGKYVSAKVQFDLLSFKDAISYAPYIAIAICKHIVQLYNLGVPVENIKLMGHSLGAHIIGAIGECFFKRTGTKLLYLYGADPSGPCSDTSIQLKSGQAEFVLIIHCNAGAFGTVRNLGDMNCYANDGKKQPGCNYPIFTDLYFTAQAERCSHMKCIGILTATARNLAIWNATLCNSYDNYIKGRCSANRTAIVGVYTSSNPVPNGTYYFTT